MRREYEDFFRAQNRALRERDREALQEVARFGRVVGEELVREADTRSGEKKIQKKAGFAVDRSRTLQKRKIRAMDSMHKKLRSIDEGENVEYPVDARGVRVISENAVEVIQPDGSAAELSLADLVADLQWGIVYKLPVDAPRRMQRRYTLERTRDELEGFRDRQMGEFDGRAKGVIGGSEKLTIKLKRGVMPNDALIGLAAERIAKSFLMRTSFDRDEMFSVSSADPVQDAYDKVDFIIDRKAVHTRGVDVEMHERDHVGIQFTRSKGGVLRKKRRKMNKALDGYETEFDDVVIVSMPGEWTHAALKFWLDAGRPSGGPEQYLSIGTRYDIFQKSLEGMFTEEEIDAMWEKVGDSKPKDVQKAA